jgi:hypothetical protein
VSRRRLKFQRKRKPTDPDTGLEKTWREMKAEQRKETS